MFAELPHKVQARSNRAFVLNVALARRSSRAKGLMLLMGEFRNFLGLAKLGVGKEATTFLLTIMFRFFPNFLNTFFLVLNFSFEAKDKTQEYLRM